MGLWPEADPDGWVADRPQGRAGVKEVKRAVEPPFGGRIQGKGKTNKYAGHHKGSPVIEAIFPLTRSEEYVSEGEA